jgi:hypothetical protein
VIEVKGLESRPSAVIPDPEMRAAGAWEIQNKHVVRVLALRLLLYCIISIIFHI